MKKALLFLLIVLPAIVPLKAQTVTNKPNIDVIILSPYRKYEESTTRYLLESYTKDIKKIKKSKQLDVIGFMNKTRGLRYDSYIIKIAKIYYCISKDDVLDNTLIEEKNKELSNEFVKLSDKCDDLSSEFDKEHSSLLNIINDSLDYYSIMIDKASKTIDSIINLKRNKAVDSLKKITDKWYNTLSPNGKKSLEVFKINNAYLGSPNSAGGCDVYLYYTNFNKKTIKYLHWSGLAKNAVNDVVSCDIRDRYSFRGQDTGPVLMGEEGGGVWECMIYNFSAKRLILNSIEIQYTDGSRFSIGGKDISILMNRPEVDLSRKSFTVEYKYEKELKSYNTKFEKWNEIRKTLYNNFSPKNTLNSSQYGYFFSNINRIVNSYNNATKALEEFKTNNFLRLY